MFAKAENGVEVTLADFYKAGKNRLQLTLLAGASHLDHKVLETAVNRPGLALTGFYEQFAWERIQVIGMAEVEYLRTLPPDIRNQRFSALIDRGAYCFIFANGQLPTDADIAHAEEKGVVVFCTTLKTRVFTTQSAFVIEHLTAPRMSVYGTMVEVDGVGVMIEGDPGLGKSETALGLVKRGNALIADDITCLRRDVVNNMIFATASEATAGYMEIRGIGIVNVARIFGASAVRREKRLDLVISLKRLSDIRESVDRVGGSGRTTKKLLGIDLPNIVIPVSAGRDIVNLIETAVMTYKLELSGYDPVMELSEHLRIRAERNTHHG